MHILFQLGFFLFDFVTKIVRVYIIYGILEKNEAWGSPKCKLVLFDS